MQDLINRVAEAAGIETEKATDAVGAILAFLAKSGPTEAMASMIQQIPGAQEMIDAQGEGGGGGLMGMLGGLMGGGGGGIMGLGAKLMGLGLSMDQMKAAGSELFKYGSEVAGEDTMGQIMSHIPGLSQFA
jgi:hypothetical protein